MTDAAVIRFEQASKVYRDFFLRQKVKALSDFNLEARPGEIVGLLGPNGSGKSTAIRLLVGLARPSSGRVMLTGGDPRRPATRARLGYLPEENANYPFLAGSKLVRFHGRLAGLSSKQAAQRADDWLARVGLDRAKHRPSGTYSKGMSRRLGLAQCLVGDPDVLVLDEPTSGLDPVATEMVRGLLQDLRKQGKCILLSSHLLAEIEDVCDRVVVLSNGKMVREGRTADLLKIPGQHDLRIRTADGSVASAAESLRKAGFELVSDSPAKKSFGQFYREVVSEPDQ